MQNISKYSGVMSMLLAWLFISAPSVFSGIDLKLQTISHATERRLQKGMISFGLTIGSGSFTQILFLSYLINKFGMSYYDPGPTLYFATAVATFFVAIFSLKDFERLHEGLVTFYFLVNPVSLLLIGTQVKDYSQLLFTTSVICVSLCFVGILALKNKYRRNNALMEKWAFLWLSVWTLVATFV